MSSRIILDPRKDAATECKYYKTVIDCRDTKPCPMFISPSYPRQQTHQGDEAARECWIAWTKDICEQVSINILNQHSIDTSVDTKLTVYWYLGQQSVDSPLNFDQCIWVGWPSTNCWSSVDLSVDWVMIGMSIESWSRCRLRVLINSQSQMPCSTYEPANLLKEIHFMPRRILLIKV